MKKIIYIVICFFTLIVGSLPVNAAVGYQGYAVYRDGVNIIIDEEWHTGILMSPSVATNYARPILHIGGLDVNLPDGGTTPLKVGRVPYAYIDEYHDTFMWEGCNFTGVYRPKEVFVENKRDLVLATCRNLTRQNILFKRVPLACPLDHNSTDEYITPDQITRMRCDGVTEYVYEWNNLEIYGSYQQTDVSKWEYFWDISRNYFLNRNAHDTITPKRQAENMILVLRIPPTDYYK